MTTSGLKIMIFFRFICTTLLIIMLIFTQGLARDKTRSDVPHIAIILTDGMSQNMQATLEESRRVHEAGITVFVIGNIL